MLKSLAIAVSMYSRIPVPNFSWDDKSAKYALCYFPFVGLIIGIAEFAAFYLLSYIETNILKLDVYKRQAREACLCGQDFQKDIQIQESLQWSLLKKPV